MTANDLDKQVVRRVSQFEFTPVWEHFELVGAGQQGELKDTTGQSNRYYQWLACLCQEVKPKQIVELGAAAGISTLVFALYAPQATIYSVDIDPQAWRWMKPGYPHVKKILGNDLDMSIWNDVNLQETDLWFIDSLHEEQQLRKELELYTPFFKKGAIVVFDDIRMPELWPVWNELTYDKCENTTPNHFTGFGFCIV